MAKVQFIRGSKQNIPTTKEEGAFYYAKDTKQFWVDDSELMKEPSTEGTDGQVLATDGNGKRSWVSVSASSSKYPSPTNRQTAPKYTNVTDLSLTPSVLFSSSVDSDSSRTARRIPSLLISNNNTYIAACEARSSLSDSSQIDILFAKKAPTDTSWTYTNIYTYSSKSKLKYMNPSLCVDRDGAEKKGRIYLFCMEFTITDSNNGDWNQLAGTEVNNYYKYSDDDGGTWSSTNEIGTNWGTEWKYSTISCSNSIVMSNGTIVCPCMGYNSSKKQHSGIVYKKKGETTWTYSCPSPLDGENECTVYENNGTLYLNVRNSTDVRRIYTYDFDNDSFTLFDDSFVPNAICEANVDEATIDCVHMYLMSFIDCETPERYNPSVWVSADGITFARAIKLYDGKVDTTAGYTICTSYNNYVIAAYEYNGIIYFVDLTTAKDVLKNGASFLTLSDQYKIEVSKTDRYSALGYLFGGAVSVQEDDREYIDLTQYASYGADGSPMKISTGSTYSQTNWKYLYIDVTEYRGKTIIVSLYNASPNFGYGITASSHKTSGNTFIVSESGTGKNYTIDYREITVPDTAVTLYVDYVYTGTFQIKPTVKMVKE